MNTATRLAITLIVTFAAAYFMGSVDSWVLKVLIFMVGLVIMIEITPEDEDSNGQTR